MLVRNDAVTEVNTFFLDAGFDSPRPFNVHVFSASLKLETDNCCIHLPYSH